MRPSLKTEALPLTLLALAWSLTLYFWPHLPNPVPSHWGLEGKPDAWTPLPWGGLIGALMTSVMYALLLVVPYLDPRRKNWEGFQSIYSVLKTALIGMGVVLTWLSLSAAVAPGQGLKIPVLTLMFGVLYLVLGNYLPKVRSNFFVGIRTPWTLSDDEVWYRTHRVTGRLMVALGLLCLLASGLPHLGQFVVVVGSALVLTLFSVAYSYWLFTRRPQAIKKP